MARKISGTIPPYINLKESIDLTKAIYERGGGSMTPDDVAALMKSTVKSSAFRLKIAAMRGFGLIQTDGQSLRITQTGKAIVAPTSPDEYQTAILEAFNSVSIYESLHQKYQGGFLPEDTFLANTVVKEFSSPSEHKEKWLKSFKESGRAAGLLREEGSKTRVLRTPSLTGGYMPEQRHDEGQQERREEQESRKQDRDYRTASASTGSFPVVLDENRCVLVPLDFSRDDLEYLQGVLELYVKRRETKGA
ncbi:MAG: hypothetical protein E6J89_19560 [Deltaproteobacteria bacterium]|nr:MAG: hypothetical protein E6J89_19560 [Deltaproteobacteria bacterium]